MSGGDPGARRRPSLLIEAGESVKGVQARLGHASAAETLDTYAHLWQDNEERTRDAGDLILRPKDSSTGGSAEISGQGA